MNNDKQSQLSALFNTLEGPTILATELSPEKALISIHVNDDLTWFDGHFPEQKVLPGVVQIDWAGTIGRALFVRDHTFKQLTNIKFKTMVMPDTRMELELIYNAEKGTLKFHFFNKNESFSMGSFKFIAS